MPPNVSEVNLRCFVLLTKLKPSHWDFGSKTNTNTKVPNFANTSECALSAEHFKTNRQIGTAEVHNDSRRHVCKTCGASFKTNSNLYRHANVHSEARPHACAICPRAFKSKDHMMVHTRTVHGPRLYSCNLCEKKMKTKHGLVEHQIVHTDAKPFACRLCAGTYKSQRILGEHMLLHGEKDFECSKCKAQFKTAAALKAHSVVHSIEKRFECDLCSSKNTRFKRKADLMSHYQRVHIREKPYLCTKCPKAFFRKFDLTKHMYTHKGKNEIAVNFALKSL